MPELDSKRMTGAQKSPPPPTFPASRPQNCPDPAHCPLKKAEPADRAESEICSSKDVSSADKLISYAGLTVHVYHGKGKEVSAAHLARFGLVVTTYTTLSLQAPSRPPELSKNAGIDTPIDLCTDDSDDDDDDGAAAAAAASAAAGGGAAGKRAAAAARKKKRKRAPPGALFQIAWHRVVLDEAQAIKNPRTLVAHATWSLKVCKSQKENL